MEQETAQHRIYLELTPDMRQQLSDSMHWLLHDLDVELPTGIELSEGPLPSAGDGIVDKDWGIVINITIDLNLSPAAIAAVGGSVTGIILALSKFLKDRAHEPKVATVDDVVEITGDDGRPRKILAQRRQLVEPGPQLKAEIEGRLKKGKHMAIGLKVET